MTLDEHTYGETYAGTRVLVTGGAGFIGSHLARRLAALGAEVCVLDDLSTGHRSNLESVRVDLRVGSILDEAALDEAAAGCRIVFHEAAMVSVPLSIERPEACFAVNVTGTRCVLEAARAHGAERVVFASSAAVYGDEPAMPSAETDPLACCSPYAASKAGGEALVAAYGRCYKPDTVSLRYFNIFGPGQDPRSPYAAVIAAFIDAFGAGRPPIVHGDGAQTRDFTYVDDVVHANLLAGAADGALAGAPINIGTGRSVTLLEVIAALEAHGGAAPPPRHADVRAGDVRHSRADVGRARARLGYEPLVPFEDGLGRTVDCSLS